MGGLLREIDSRELAEWAAYEREYGALGPEYERAALREIEFQIKALQRLTAAFKTEKGKPNPVPEPERMPTPTDYMRPEEDEDAEDED